MSIVPLLRSSLGRVSLACASLLLAGSPAVRGQSNLPSSADGYDPNVNGIVYAMAAQPDGKMIVAGNFTTLQPNGTGVAVTRNNIARLNADGSLDAGFNPSVNAQVNSVALQADGRIVIGGVFTTVGGVPHTGFARLNADGTPDASVSFSIQNTTAPAVYAVATQADGKFLVAGAFTSVLRSGASAATARNRIARFNADGTLDTSFDPNASGTVYSLAVQADGRILLGGLFTTLQPNGGSPAITRNSIARLNPDGSIDAGFDPNANASIMTIAVQPDGGILIGGFFQSLQPNGADTAIPRNHVARLNADGTVDPLFNPNASGNVTAIAIAPDGSVMVGGLFTTIGSAPRAYLARITAGGVVDPFFNPGVNYVVNAIVFQPDGKFVIGGNFIQLQPGGAVATTRNHLARLNATGTPDVSLDPNVGGRVSAIAAQADGKVLIGGVFGSVAGVVRNNLARVNADGSLDTAFNPNISGAVNVITVQPDGKILVGGTFSYAGVVARNNLVRLNADGTVDMSFDPNPNGTISAIIVQSDGKLLVGGNFGTVTPNGAATAISRQYLARLNGDGTLDTTFNPNFNGNILALKILSDGRIIVAGNFIALNASGLSFATPQNYIVRLSAAGVVDTTFIANPNNRVDSFVVQPDGKIVIAGLFTTVQHDLTVAAVARNHVARLNADGSLDTSFDPNASSNSEVRAIAMQSDGKLLIGGNFLSLQPNGASTPTSRPNFARLNADGSLDTSLDARVTGAVNAILVQSDDKILIGGSFTSLQPNGSAAVTLRDHLARLNADGSLDTGYDPAFTNLPGTVVTDVAIQSDGKILLGGTFNNIGGASGSNLVRFQPEGTLDATFNPAVDGPVNTIAVRTTNSVVPAKLNGFTWLTSAGLPQVGFNASANALIVGQIDVVATQSDGSILLGGAFSNNSGATGGNLVRFAADGTLDTSFNPLVNGEVKSIVFQADGKILIGGIFTSVNSTTRDYIARLNPDGSLDTTYNPTAGNEVDAMVLQPNGKLVIGGNFTSFSANGNGTVSTHSYLARINTDGTIDSSFNPSANAMVSALALQSDGKIVVGGSFTMLQSTARNYIGRINGDGSLDTTFDPNSNGVVETLQVQPDGQILVGGFFTQIAGVTRNHLARLHADGTAATDFDPNVSNLVTTVLLQPNGQILVGGYFSTIGGVARNNVARLNADGSLDASFDPNLNSSVNAVAVLPDGSILVGGVFTEQRPYGIILAGGAFAHVNGSAAANLVLLNEDGNANSGFLPNPNGAVNALLLLPDGRFVVGGDFTTIAGAARSRLARFNADGSLDGGFNPGADGAVYSLALQADGKVLVGGAFSQVAGGAASHLARVNTDGSFDGSFNPGANDSVTALAIEADGSVIVAGPFTAIGGAPRSHLARLGAGGALDGAFAPAANGGVNAIAVQANGAVIVGGAFTAISGTARNHLARLQADGSVDVNFDPNADDVVYAAALQSDGKPVVGGSFAHIGGQARYRFARLAADTIASQTIGLSGDGTTLTWTRGGSAPEVSWVTFEQSTDDINWTPLGTATRVSGTGTWQLAASLSSSSVYYVRARGAAPTTQYGSSGVLEAVQAFFPRPAISSATTATGAVGTSFIFGITAANSPGSYAAAGLPPGLSLNAATGVISGVPTQIGTYAVTLTVANNAGSSTRVLTLTIGAAGSLPSTTTHLVNASTRAYVSPGNPLFVGFIISGTAPKTVLIRGIGPGLTSLGVSGALALPHLLLFNESGQELLENDGWHGDSSLAGIFASVGAFPLNPGSTDTAAVVTLPPGAYTIQVVDAGGGGGVALAEAYDAGGSSVFANLSARGPSTGSGNPLIAGFVISGTAPKRMLVRGIGPGLTAYGVTDALADPVVSVFDVQGHLIAQNDNWSTQVTVDSSQPASDPATIAGAAAGAGAFALAPAGLDAAVIVTLPPGLYTVQVSGVNGVTGSALAELYELP